MKYAYYPGCSAESTARDLHTSSLAVSRVLGIELVEPEGWSCCGATPGHQTDSVLAASLAALNLSLAKDMALDMVVNCAECFSRLKIANHEIAGNVKVREQVADAMGRDYDGSVKVRHLLEVLLEDVGIESIQAKMTSSLKGFKVACYYGCLLVRPPEITNFDHPENPVSMDRLVKAIGGESIDWPHKVECCGGGLSLTRTDVVIDLVDAILGMAKDAGAECVAVACPMCQVNLDMRQSDIRKKKNRFYDMPIVYMTQLIGLSLGISEKELGLKKLMVSPGKLVNAMGAAV